MGVEGMRAWPAGNRLRLRSMDAAAGHLVIRLQGLPAHLDHVQQQREQALLDAVVPHYVVAPQVETQLVHRRLVGLLHVDAVHVLHS